MKRTDLTYTCCRLNMPLGLTHTLSSLHSLFFCPKFCLFQCNDLSGTHQVSEEVPSILRSLAGSHEGSTLSSQQSHAAVINIPRSRIIDCIKSQRPKFTIILKSIPWCSHGAIFSPISTVAAPAAAAPLCLSLCRTLPWIPILIHLEWSQTPDGVLQVLLNACETSDNTSKLCRFN